MAGEAYRLPLLHCPEVAKELHLPPLSVDGPAWGYADLNVRRLRAWCQEFTAKKSAPSRPHASS